MNRTALAILSILAIAGAAAAQGGLGRADSAPLADGTVEAGEYPFTASASGARISLALAPDASVLYAAIDAPTRGWVALGLGSRKMNGASIFMAEDRAGSPVVSEQLGSGHGHKGSDARLIAASAVKTSGGRTVFEFSLPAGSFVAGGSLELIYAFGGANMGAYHLPFSRGAMSVPIEP